MGDERGCYNLGCIIPTLLGRVTNMIRLVHDMNLFEAIDQRPPSSSSELKGNSFCRYATKAYLVSTRFEDSAGSPVESLTIGSSF